MTKAISPDSVSVDREVELQGKFTKESGLVRWLADQYKAAGWVVTTHSDMKAPDKWVCLRFERPGLEAKE